MSARPRPSSDLYSDPYPDPYRDHDPDSDYLPYTEDDLSISLCLDSLPDFIRAAWPILEPSTPLSWNWHLDEICDVLTRARRHEQGFTRLVINIPPGCMKSMLLTLFAAWVWTSEPHTGWLTFSYSDANTIRDNRRLREVVTSPWYRSSFWTPHPGIHNCSCSLASDQSAKIRFDTTARGWRIASSVDGIGTGDHPHYIVVDDPTKAKDARSPTVLANCNDWFDRTIPTRIMNDPVMIVPMQRLHLDDLSGHLLAKGNWTHVCFPMRYRPPRPKTAKDPAYVPDPRDRRTEPGQLLWPEKWPEDKVRNEEVELGPFASAAQLDQSPVPEGGGLIKREWLQVVDAPPSGPHVLWCRGWDTADTPGGGDWTVGAKLAYDTSTGRIYVTDVIRDQLSTGSVNRTILQTAKVDGRNVLIREGSGVGKATTNARAVALHGYDYAASPETAREGDKVARAGPFRAQCEVGNVFLVAGPWNEPYISVLTSFPVGKYDDDVDATANAYNALVAAPVPQPLSLVWGPKPVPTR